MKEQAIEALNAQAEALGQALDIEVDTTNPFDELYSFDRGCDGQHHWTDILMYGKCAQCKLGY
jgi:hypothetical protein